MSEEGESEKGEIEREREGWRRNRGDGQIGWREEEEGREKEREK